MWVNGTRVLPFDSGQLVVQKARGDYLAQNQAGGTRGTGARAPHCLWQGRGLLGSALVAVQTWPARAFLNGECEMAWGRRGARAWRIRPSCSGYWYLPGSMVSPTGHNLPGLSMRRSTARFSPVVSCGWCSRGCRMPVDDGDTNPRRVRGCAEQRTGSTKMTYAARPAARPGRRHRRGAHADRQRSTLSEKSATSRTHEPGHQRLGRTRSKSERSCGKSFSRFPKRTRSGPC